MGQAGLSRRKQAFAELQEDEYGNVVDPRFLPELHGQSREAAGSNKGVALALFLFAFGSFLLSLGLLFRFEVIPVREENPGLALIILGSLTFIPGFYYSRIAYYAWKRVPGFSYGDIPYYE